MTITNINTNLFKFFLAVFQYGSISKAAQELLMSPSTVWQGVRELEKQLDTERLFVKTNKGVRPTDEAVKLHAKIKNAFGLISEAEQDIKTFDENTEAVIKLSAPSTLASHFFHEYFKDFCRQYSKVKFEFFDKHGNTLLAESKIDFVIDLEQCFEKDNFITVNLLTLHGIFITSNKFLIERKLKNTISREILVSLPIIAHREPWNDVAKSIGLQGDNPLMIVASTEFAQSMARNDIGVVYYYDELLSSAPSSDVVKLTIKDIQLPQIKIACAYNKHISKPAKVFLEGLIKFCKDAKYL